MRYLRKAFAHRRWIAAPVLVLLLGAAIAGGIYWGVARALRGAEQAINAETNLRFIARPYAPQADTGFEWVSAPAVFTQAAEFNGHLYVAGPAGLNEYDERGNPLRDFRPGRELPPSPLRRLARATLADSRQPELVIATADAGILAFDGVAFRQILPELPAARSITAILPVASGRLLIGTDKAGLLVYDGQRLSPFHATFSHVRVAELAGTETDLWIGTADRGVAHWHGGSADWFGEAEGLPDERVYAIALAGDRAYAGTPAGIAEFDQGRFARVLAAGAFVRALLPRKNLLLAGTMDDGIVDIPLARGPHAARPFGSANDLAEVEQIFSSGESVFAVTTSGVFSRGAAGGWKRVLTAASGLLTDRNISALAVDAGHRLWVGYFDRGLDIVDASSRHAQHVEDDRVFCINRIVPNAAHGATAVATANGLVLFEGSGAQRQVLGRNDGLIADHVTDVALYRDGMALATPAGLTFMDSGGVRSLYAFHGLVNNHVYALGANGRQLLAGTLGGASLLEADEVRASFTTANSALKHNWITAVVALDGEWWLGTYGAGVVHLDSTGRFEPANGASGDLIVNPNAMMATNGVVAAGTLGHGLYVMDRGSNRWFAITDGLPSLNVTAMAAADGYVYVGTDNGLVRIPEQRLAR